MVSTSPPSSAPRSDGRPWRPRRSRRRSWASVRDSEIRPPSLAGTAPPASPAVSRTGFTSGPLSSVPAARNGTGGASGRETVLTSAPLRLPTWSPATGESAVSPFRAKCRPMVPASPAVSEEREAAVSISTRSPSALECLPIALMALSMGSRARLPTSTPGPPRSSLASTGAGRSPPSSGWDSCTSPAFTPAPPMAASGPLSLSGPLSGMTFRRCLSKAAR